MTAKFGTLPHALSAVWLVLVLGACSDSDLEVTRPAPLLLISIDGFRHDYIGQTRLPAIERLAAEGLRADSLTHIFPTKTFATHYAMVTGLYAENSGVVANNMWDPDRRTRFSLGDRDAVSDGYWYDGEPIWNTVEKAGRIAATYFWPGSEAQIGGMRPTYFKPYAGDTPHDERVDQVLDWLDLPDDQRPDFLTLYFSAVDSAGHRHGPGAAETLAAARDVDRALGRLIAGLEERGLFGRMHILLTSDHGMREIDIDRYVLLEEYLDLSRVRVSDWGPAAQIWRIEGGPDPEAIAAAIDPAHPGIRRVWTRGNAPARYRFDDHRRIPDVVVEAEPGWMISNKPLSAAARHGVLKGMHGWDPAWLDMHGVFIAHGPAFTAGDRLPAVRSVDLYALMAELMAVPPAATDGSLTAFEPLLRSHSPVSVRKRRWRCAGGREFTTRATPGIAALHSDTPRGRQVFALPRTIGASGVRYTDADIEFFAKGDRALIKIEGRRFGDCITAGR